MQNHFKFAEIFDYQPREGQEARVIAARLLNMAPFLGRYPMRVQMPAKGETGSCGAVVFALTPQVYIAVPFCIRGTKLLLAKVFFDVMGRPHPLTPEALQALINANIIVGARHADARVRTTSVTPSVARRLAAAQNIKAAEGIAATEEIVAAVDQFFNALTPTTPIASYPYKTPFVWLRKTGEIYTPTAKYKAHKMPTDKLFTLAKNANVANDAYIAYIPPVETPIYTLLKHAESAAPQARRPGRYRVFIENRWQLAWILPVIGFDGKPTKDWVVTTGGVHYTTPNPRGIFVEATLPKPKAIAIGMVGSWLIEKDGKPYLTPPIKVQRIYTTTINGAEMTIVEGSGKTFVLSGSPLEAGVRHAQPTDKGIPSDAYIVAAKAPFIEVGVRVAMQKQAELTVDKNVIYGIFDVSRSTDADYNYFTVRLRVNAPGIRATKVWPNVPMIVVKMLANSFKLPWNVLSTALHQMRPGTHFELLLTELPDDIGVLLKTETPIARNNISVTPEDEKAYLQDLERFAKQKEAYAEAVAHAPSYTGDMLVKTAESLERLARIAPALVKGIFTIDQATLQQLNQIYTKLVYLLYYTFLFGDIDDVRFVETLLDQFVKLKQFLRKMLWLHKQKET